MTLYRGRTVTLPARVRRNGGWDTPVEVWVENPHQVLAMKNRLSNRSRLL